LKRRIHTLDDRYYPQYYFLGGWWNYSSRLYFATYQEAFKFIQERDNARAQ
jgi:hypothetical protein